jgi:phospholipid-translocating ATPase
MRFRKISVAGTAWLHDADLREEAAREADRVKLLHKKRTKGKQALARKSSTSETAAMARKSNTSAFEAQATPPIAGVARTSSVASHWKSSAQPQNTYHGGRTEEMLAYIQHKPLTLFARRAKFFILSLALCNTCVPEKDVDGNITFQAASPDELALVKAAQDLGYLVVDRRSNNMTVRTFPSGSDSDPVYETYEILDVIEFSSARKRMSIIIRMPDNRVCVFCKGADSTLMRLLRLSKLAADKVADIEQRKKERKSMEAQQAIRRLSEHRRSSTTRTSMSIPRVSMGGRSSMTRGRLPSIRDDIDHWLKERQTDGSASPVDHNSIYYSARPSIQLLSGRQSLARSEGRKSLQKDSADEVVEESLVLNDSTVFERCFQHINDFASEGLRTLLYGYRYLDEEEYAAWKKSYQEATTSLIDRQFLIEKAGNEIERDFELIGATAIEDKLQKGVPEAIDKLRRANIKLWMLTGDKRETAINIGHSCRLLKDYSTMTILDHEAGGVDQRIAAAIVDINSGTVAHSVIVIDGQTLSMIEAQQIVKDLFIDLAILADSVICCRASPSQKASLVKSIRKKVKKSVTLAIGDGANDIAMIQEAHVGIGITGKEGLQAARVSDYSIAQFRFLLKLLLVHGRWNYIRVCKYTLGTFWKEMLFYLTQALYQRWAGYTGTSLYEPWSLSMFNTLFTSLPVIFMGVFEKDLAASTLLAVPELYTKGQRNGGFNIRVYLWWTFMAASDSMVVFFIMLGLYGQALFTLDNGLYAMGALTFTACIIIISTKMQVLEMHNKSITSVIAILLSVGGWFAFNLALSGIYKDNTIYNVKDGLLDRFGRNALWWLVVILIVTSVVLYELGISSMRAVLWPTDVDIFQEYEQDREIRKRFEEASAEELQAGWDRGTKKSSVEFAREEALEAEREAEVQEILDRPRTMEEGKTRSRAMASVDFSVRRRHSGSEGVEMDEIPRVGADGGGSGEAKPRKSVEIQELFFKGFGSVRKGQTLK